MARGRIYRPRPKRQKRVASRETIRKTGPQNIALPDGMEDFDWQPGQPIENDGTGTVANRSRRRRVVRIPDWDHQ